jgi:formiminoglutamase
MYRPIVSGAWSGRVDAEDGLEGRRWHQVVRYINLEKDQLPLLTSSQKGITILGFCTDEGVRRNQGRVGAKGGPDQIRKYIMSLPVHFQHTHALIECGNVYCESENLEQAQEEAGQTIFRFLSHSFLSVVLGGGHEIAYGHFLGIASFLEREKKLDQLGVINLDAHFDLRRSSVASSGTPFLQMANYLTSRELPFAYFCIGIQESGNTQALFQVADSLHVKYIQAGDVHMVYKDQLLKQIDEFIATKKYIYLTICLDVFAAAYAPGVSAPTANGILPDIAIEVITYLMKSKKVIACDLAELNPDFDTDDRTARLASKLIYTVVQNYFEA